jgi:DNA-binding response OmpR family regulator
MAKILLVDDDTELLATVSDWLKSEGHAPDTSANGSDALDLLRSFQYDIIVLDWQMPGLSGLDVLKRLRSDGCKSLILMLTGKDAVDDKAQGLDAGADDYLTKPFHPKELSSRLRALLRRSREVAPTDLIAGDLVVKPVGFQVLKAGKEVKLLPKEFALLEFLMRHQNETFSAEALMDRVWSSDSEASPETVRVHITRVRAKIDTPGEPSIIKTVHRVGYKLEVDKKPE